MPDRELSINRLSIALARFLSGRSKLAAADKPAFERLVQTVSEELNNGHNCMLVSDEDKALLMASGLAAIADGQNTALPLVVDRNRLYLYRYWFYENRLAERIRNMLGESRPVNGLNDLLDIYFGRQNEQIDWQREAARTAVSRSFTIITGGPGTGKTTTVVKILALLQTVAAHPLQIALAGPTGKAAMRLKESISFYKSRLPCSEEIKQRIPESVTTLHRLLGAKPLSPYFRYHAEHPLVYDVIVVDEASMIDLALMSKLLDALKPSARLILLGDKDQLASVESGAVLADLTQALPEHTVELKLTHRFDENIKKLASLVNLQLDEEAWRLVQAGNEAVSLLAGDPVKYIADRQSDYLRLIAAGAPFEEVSQARARFQVLCANREGRLGVTDVNDRVEQLLSRKRSIRLTGSWYSGRPVIITQNNPALHLYNGDTGICMADKDQGGKLMVFFQSADGAVRKYLPSRITHCQTVFAMTIHKSQGSEFEEVLIVLPAEINPVLTKELVYTAITRAKKTVKVLSGESVFRTAVKQRVNRITGLIDALSAGDRHHGGTALSGSSGRETSTKPRVFPEA
ncbi:exodeoxyribonuclease V subunit alpha [Methylosarcina fibrata]|uniref:exodeoxyribonuclease V subunit alpha n=1 Tax=Methylosarcina fibrata TaxID=105972 RepID=UPI00036690E9|nr:exodeoxyribonuclease V subunit alpha [Methylosarcina fibrata]